MTKKAPGRWFAHLDARIKGAGGTLGDSARGSKEAAGDGYKWIDNNGHSSSDSKPFNMHGSPFNPFWMKRGDKLEKHPAAWIQKNHPRLRTALTTFQQNMHLGLSTEWEVKDLRPVASNEQLATYFGHLAEAAETAYGSAWRRRVQVKCLTNLGGGLPYAFRVLEAAHAAGFTTIVLPRGKHKRQVINEPFIDFNRRGRV